MRYLNSLLIFIMLFSPLPPGYAVNPHTGECGSLGGLEDEYARYWLLPPWEKHYSDTIQNGNASCQLGQAHTVEFCCKQVGYAFVPGEIGEQHGIRLWTPAAFLVLIIKILPFVLIGLALYYFLKWVDKGGDPNKAV